MFGLVPKPIWSKRIPPNDRNAIPQNANVLLVELDDGQTGLVDTGCGDPAGFSEKELALHGMANAWPLMEALDRMGIEPDAIHFVLLTHLHWDHAGGVGRMQAGQARLTFPNARCYIHEQEWADALSGDPLLYKSYPADTIEPLKRLPDTQRLLVSDGHTEVLPGIHLRRSSGHTRGHCVIDIQDPRLKLDHPGAAEFGPVTRLLFTGDVCPTQHHLRLVFQTAYDTYPLDTRKWKQEWLPVAAAENIPLFFDHDPDICAARIRRDERTEYRVTRTLH